MATAYGVVSDFASPSEREAVVGFIFVGYQSIQLLQRNTRSLWIHSPSTAPLFGPIIGGALAQYLVWRAVSWLLTFFPETCRSIVGSGRIPATGLNRNLLDYLWLEKCLQAGSKETLSKRKFGVPSPMTSVYIIFHRDTFLIMMSYGVFHTTCFFILASTSSLFMERYQLNGVQGGLMHFPSGLGSKAHDFVVDKVGGDDLSNFPIEKARLRSLWYIISLCANIAIPLLFQFFVGTGSVAVFNTLQTLLVDLYTDIAAIAQAGLNVVRSSLAACGTAALRIIMD
ncbi:hypothetical protein MBM_06266 [Drepanopeziza brunnea f. sp. 'multigermtubi' MB_m1]|uniref:Uncharacterized protein n=1 Tax=Marssonina brunnea f. sp. multigermtubi (strain MB_m1) TaxID=1072389 RepID=K1X4S5_MARBU|nr:uncharacterized protein MBM_06266 [Drepanopeziza brunnea f. sp. 'multigermtubi' MB_m1]EKD15638.1 hypothetical protein MBM_06266 [Drepanopeziza brunnea f. sp. 'multigermtubi' MB_m1]